MRALIAEGVATAVHDVSDGGLLVALAEMAMASGIGAELDRAAARRRTPSGSARTRRATSSPSPRDMAEQVIGAAPALPASRRASSALTGGDALTLPGERPILVAKLRERFEGWLPAYMAVARLIRILCRYGSATLLDVTESAMAMDASEIERLIKARIPDAEVTIRDLAGDGDHYAATVIADPSAASRGCSSTRSSTKRSRPRWAASCTRSRCRPARRSA